MAAQLDAAVPALLQSGAAQHEIFAAVLDALRGAPYVLIVEDLHWGDEATLDLVRFLARRIATLPLLLVLSYRDAVAVDHPLRTVLGDLVSSPDARRLQLAPLSRLGRRPARRGPRLDADDVHRRTAGNPFFVSQIVAQPDAPLPDSVRDAVVARIAALTPAVRRHWSCCRARPRRPTPGCSARSAWLRRPSMRWWPPGWSTATRTVSRSGTRSPGPRSWAPSPPAPSRRCTRR